MIIGISGKIGSGKDTVGQVIQYLQYRSTFNVTVPVTRNNFDIFINSLSHQDQIWKIKKFADKLKDITCVLIGCTREQLEDSEFKEKELGEEWWYHKINKEHGFSTKLIKYNGHGNQKHLTVFKHTPRTLLQLLGTECGRNIIHPNIWVNALFSEYNDKYRGLSIFNAETKKEVTKYENNESNWIITDMRFPNELKVVKDRNGISIRVNRIEKGKTYTIQDKQTKEIFKAKADIDYRSYDDVVLRCENNFVHRLPDYNILYENTHPSETALDNAEFGYVIDNNGTIEDLVEKVKEILIKEKLI